MAHTLVTGGAGFIGSHLVERLLAHGERVRVLDNFSTGRRQCLALAATSAQDLALLEVVEGDIRDPERVRQAMSGVDHVAHLAAVASVQQSMADPLTTHAVNATGTLHLLQAAREAGVQSVVLASSCAVYGDNDELPLSETAQPRPLSPYAASKLAAETYCQTFAAAYGLRTISLRYFNVYGPRQNPEGDYAAVIAKFLQRMVAGRPPVIYGDGEQTRDFVCVDDIVQATLRAAAHRGPGGQVLNVASGRRVSLLDLVAALNDLLGTNLAPELQPARAGDIRHSVGDGTRLAELLGYRAETPLPEGLRRLVSGGTEVDTDAGGPGAAVGE